MPTLRISPKCPKCGNGPSKITVKYHRATTALLEKAGQERIIDFIEYLTHTCECSYVWITKCLDAKEQK